VENNSEAVGVDAYNGLLPILETDGILRGTRTDEEAYGRLLHKDGKKAVVVLDDLADNRNIIIIIISLVVVVCALVVVFNEVMLYFLV
jgi:hypothetical protein